VIITLAEDGVLRVYESVRYAVRAVEPLDATETFRAIFDETGEVYSIRWIRPNKRGRFLFSWVENGEYTLVAANRKDVPGLLKLLNEARHIDPSSAEPWLRDLRRRLGS